MNAQYSMFNEEVNATRTQSHEETQNQFSNQLIFKLSHFLIIKLNTEQGMINDECSMFNEDVIATRTQSHEETQNQLSNQLIFKLSHFLIIKLNTNKE